MARRPRRWTPRREAAGGARGCVCTSKSKLHRKLRLEWIAHSLAQEPVKIEQARGHQRVDVVAIVESVEHFNHRCQHVAISEVERPKGTPVKGEEAIVFTQVVATAINAVHYTRQRITRAARRPGAIAQRIVRDRLGCVGLDASAELETSGQPGVRVKIEFVTAIAVREGVVLAEVELVEVAEGERIAFVGIVVKVF